MISTDALPFWANFIGVSSHLPLITAGRKKEEGRKKGDGRRRNEEGRITKEGGKNGGRKRESR